MNCRRRCRGAVLHLALTWAMWMLPDKRPAPDQFCLALMHHRLLPTALLSMLLAPLAGCADDEPRTRVAALTAEPGSAKFQSVRDSGNYVCGEVNGKDRQGGYGGYRRFVYDRRKEAAVIDPGVQDVAARTPNTDAACAKVFAYQTVEERLTCAYAPAQQAGSDRQRQFETLWVDACGGERASNAESAPPNPEGPTRQGDRG